MKTFIRVAEVWLPDRTGSMLEWGGGMYLDAPRFRAHSQTLCFGRGEGLPGQAWDRQRPIVLKEFAGSYFRRTQVAHAEGLTCAIALPVFAGQALMAVLLLFCADDASTVGAIELWHNDPQASADLTLDDGYYGQTAEVFEFISRQTAFRPGSGLPGMAWASGRPVYLPDLGKGTRFLRADSAVKVGINRGLALPWPTPGTGLWVVAFLSALATPIARRFEIWLPDDVGGSLHRSEGHCETTGPVEAGGSGLAVERGDGAIGRVLADCKPVVSERAARDEGPVGAAARASGSTTVVALPLLADGRVVAVVAWYF
jgi:hypothetical protein